MKKSIALFLGALLLLTGCGTRRNSPQEPELPHKYSADFFDVFDTYTTVAGYAGSQEEFDGYVAVIHDEMLRLHRLFDIYNDYEGIANLKTVNSLAGIEPVEVDASIIDLLLWGKRAHGDTLGSVNIAMGSVLRVWHDYRTAGASNPQAASLPGDEQLRAASLHTNIEDIIIDEEIHTVFLLDSEMSLDVGALAKGYAAQAAVDLAVEAGFTSGILSAGGNVCAIGSPADGRQNWSIGIQSPEKPLDSLTAEIVDTIYIHAMSAVSSGDYQRFYEVDGIAYHHIIDPDTLYPARQARAVTVLHPNSTWADILSTAAYILPADQAMELVQFHGGQAIWLLDGDEARVTDGYRAVSERY